MAGRGGMGEVYRADDLKLGQVVALKFLPVALSRDVRWLERFHREVRIARAISHPHVCRVYDIGEAAGQHFLSMEFVAGEDLASLLRQIGRLPRKKALAISFQLCAGLAVIHGRGIVHRDLKPANLMLDDEGSVRITDFGLASRIGEREEGCVGTPHYMAPEQLAGKEATRQSDLYSLGLILYEVFTGKPAFEADTLEMLRSRRESAPARPSSVFQDCDPEVERVILWCLERDPDRRPESVLEVLGALPGGDALAQALAMGETPSPAMVAASGEVGILRPRVGLALVTALLAGLGAVAFLNPRTHLLSAVDPDHPPEVLADRARQVLKTIGKESGVADRAYGFSYEPEALRFSRGSDAESRSRALCFWYRQSPQLLSPRDVFAGGRVSLSDPPPTQAAMAHVVLDARGSLLDLRTNPPRLSAHAMLARSTSVDSVPWEALFQAAGFSLDDFHPVAPVFTPPVHGDRRHAWERTDELGETIRVEAASFEGEPVSFQILAPWQQWAAEEPLPGSRRLRVFETLSLLLFAEVTIAGLLLVRRNLKLGRGDRRGAFRLAAFVFAVRMASWLLQASHVPSLEGELRLLTMALGRALYPAVILWVIYMALEPYVRSLWPRAIVSWTRLLAGHVRDPLVGRDLLMGSLVGIVWTLFFQIDYLVGGWSGQVAAAPLRSSVTGLLGPFELLGEILSVQPTNIFKGLAFLLLLFLLRVVLRRQVWTALGFVAIATLLHSFLTVTPWLGPILALSGSLLLLLLLVRSGALAAVAAFAVSDLLLRFPILVDPGSWTASSSLLVLGIVILLAGFGFMTALAGRPILREPVG